MGLVIDAYLLAVGRQRLSVGRIAVGMSRVLLAPLVKSVLVVAVHLLLRPEYSQHLVTVVHRHRIAVFGACEQRPCGIQTFVDSGGTGFVANLLHQIGVERHIDVDTVTEVVTLVVPTNRHLMSLIADHTGIEIYGYSVCRVIGVEVITHSSGQAERATVEHIACLAVIVVVRHGEPVAEEPEIDTCINLVDLFPLEVFVAHDGYPCTGLPDRTVVKRMTYTAERVC